MTGGAGFIGSHTMVELLNAGLNPVALDNLSNSNFSVFDRIREIAGREFEFIVGDVRDRTLLDSIFKDKDIEAVIHFAGLKAVVESTQFPLAFLANNLNGTIHLHAA